MKMIYRSIMANLILVLLLCGVYPAVVTLLGQVFFSDQANGSLILGKDGKVIGSKFIGQNFSKPEYFHSRPSSAGDKGYDAANSSASNLGPTNQKLFDAVKGNVDAFLKDNPTVKKGEVPVDMVTGSGSGLDPHISPEGAYAQIERVASARRVPVSEVKAAVERHIEGPQWGLFGEPVINVLELNLALDGALDVKSP
jgi:potassium-transporting ATPase KdpC subunit